MSKSRMLIKEITDVSLYPLKRGVPSFVRIRDRFLCFLILL